MTSGELCKRLREDAEKCGKIAAPYEARDDGDKYGHGKWWRDTANTQRQAADRIEHLEAALQQVAVHGSTESGLKISIMDVLRCRDIARSALGQTDG